MSAAGVFDPLRASEPFARALAAARGDGPAVTLTGLIESSKALLLTLLRRELARPVLLVTADDRSAEEWRRDLRAFSHLIDPEERLGSVLRFPALDVDPWLGLPVHAGSSVERVAALHALAAGEASVVVAPARALVNPLPTPESFLRRIVRVETGAAFDLEAFALSMVGLGYRTVDVVGSTGEWARRGGIVDAWSPSAEAPVRIELDGDAVGSLRTFDPDSQRSVESLDEARILPVGEVPTDEAARERIARAVEERASRRLAARGEGAASELTGDRWIALLRGEPFQGIEGCARYALDEVSDLFAHAAQSGGAAGAALVFDEPDRAIEELETAYSDMAHSRDSVGGPLPGPEHLFLEPPRIRAALASAPLRLMELRIGEGIDDLPVLCQPSRNYAGRIAEWRGDVERQRAEGRRVVFLLNAPGTIDRAGELLAEAEIPFVKGAPPEPAGDGDDGGAAPPVTLLLGHLNHGFLLPEAGLVLMAERELFGEEPRQRARKRRKGASFVSDFRDLRPGNLVVHVDHGIGRFEGLHRMGGAASHRDFMLVTYEAGDRLFVPVDRLDLVQKYGRPGDRKKVRSKLDRLGGTGWERRRRRARKAVQDIARDLLHLYARRMAAKGHAFSPDTPWQKEFEDGFPYTLTPDQVRAVAEVKADMESERPMERLLCGDVGFGKTEVALRAAFKAIQDGRQVAVLAPTTVLAFQHLNTFRERFAAFPVRIEMMSRFRTPAELRVTAKATADGSVDLLVGTHRILSKDVKFKRLGLLVIDEEQRFGVTHKERIKSLSHGVDVLAMTATPIPRTLQMSLAGVRDMSLIETPPQNRLSIQTSLVPFKRGLVAAAIRNEMRRGGQIYFVHNRIDSIHTIAAKIQEIVPEAKIVVGHGQMGRAELESVMMKFLRAEYDILLSTTIIENGLDIPRVNTLMVNQADRFGLAQLYQLRGRIGRSDVRAYAYFFVPGRRALSTVARRRLLALQEFSELGSGFRLAAMDLEIRGAGELLGARQHGHIEDIGFELYVQMLERAVAEMKGEEVPEAVSVQINLGVDIRLPEPYVPEASLRLAFYKRVSSAEDESELDALRAELSDRFGTLPGSAENLLRLSAVRIAAMRLGVAKVDYERERIAVQFADAARIPPDRLVAWVGETPGASLAPSGVLRVAVEPGADRIAAAREALGGLASAAG